ncbi:tyrosine-protein phosphatase [Nonomuraea sp. NPDC049421]|uniref:tyrosine-protein phosphatase n=1 Tax=Nonomuraea sp. NPDC049421 TaxID=3155275 RepID=UPI00341DE829
MWCTWYGHWDKVTDADVIENLELSERLGLGADMFLIDDGCEAEIGDWLEPRPASARRHVTVVPAIVHAPPGATLVHCHFGKDRTGLASALTLTLAGVASADVAEDYAETAARLSIDAHLAALPGEAERARSRRLFAEVGAGTMLATLAHLDDRYGGAAAYLREGGLPPADLTLPRTRLTTDP